MAAGTLPLIHDAGALEALVEEIGFLPFVRSGVSGFSLEECTPEGRWFVKDVKGPWEWREAVADGGRIAYGKLFRAKAGFVSLAWYPDLCNHRRGGRTFGMRYQQGEIPRAERDIMALLAQNGPMLTRDLRAAFGTKGFDRTVTSLQMRTDITVQRLEYNRDAFGRPYGWGIARLAPSDHVFGSEVTEGRFAACTPEASLQRLCRQVEALFPNAAERDILRLLR